MGVLRRQDRDIKGDKVKCRAGSTARNAVGCQRRSTEGHEFEVQLRGAAC